jgi:hypothetical protein
LKDFDHQKAENYSKYFGLSRPFVMAVNGFYALDNKQYDIGVGYLSDTAVDLDDPPEYKFGWNEKIIKTLQVANEYQLCLSFIHSTNSSFWSSELIQLVLKSYVKIGISESIQFQRNFDVQNLKMIFDGCFERIYEN